MAKVELAATRCIEEHGSLIPGGSWILRSEFLERPFIVVIAVAIDRGGASLLCAT